MSSTAENEARKKLMSVMEPDRVRITVKVSWIDGICIPDSEGKNEETAVFATLTYGDNWAIERAVTREIEVDGGRAIVGISDVNEYRRLLVKKSLLSWTLDIPIERDSLGWMRPECYERVSKIPAPLMEAFVGGLEDSVEITEDEEKKITRQCASLFSGHGKGVMDPCEAVSMFCTFGNYWEKFGLDKEKLPRMLYRDYLLLKMMISKEGEMTRQVAKPRPQSTTKIAGAGGKIRPSRGVSMPG